MELLVSKPFSDPKSAAMSSKNLLQAESLEVADSVLSVEGEGIATINKELNFSSEQVLESIQRALDQIKNK